MICSCIAKPRFETCVEIAGVVFTIYDGAREPMVCAVFKSPYIFLTGFPFPV